MKISEIETTKLELTYIKPLVTATNNLCELGEFEVITGDPFFGLSVEKGTISVPEGEGLGVSRRGF